MSGSFLHVLVMSSAASIAAEPCEDGQAGEFPCSRVDLAAFVPAENIGGATLNDLWGWEHDGRRFAVVGRHGGTSFVEITDPEDPVYLGQLPTRSVTSGTDAMPESATPPTAAHCPAGGGKCNIDAPAEPGSLWRDIKVHQDHALIVSEEEDHGLQVFDLTRLLDVQDPPEEFNEDDHYDGFGSAHNLELNPETGLGLAVGSDRYEGGPYFLDLSEPRNPEKLAGFAEDGYTHDAQCVEYAGPAEELADNEICFASNEDTLTVLDASDPESVEILSRTDYPRVGYTHQGWLSGDQRWFYLNDEMADAEHDSRTRTLVFDVADPSAPELVKEYYAPVAATHHNHYVRGDHLFQSNYTSGLRILDITTPDQPLEIAYFNSRPAMENHEFKGSWSNYPKFSDGTVIFSDIQDGLFIVQPRLPNPAADEADLRVSAELEGDADFSRQFTGRVRVRLENHGPEHAPGTELGFSLPRDGVLDPISELPGDCDLDDHRIRCRLGQLDSGAEKVIELDAGTDLDVDGGLHVWASSALPDPATEDNRVRVALEPANDDDDDNDDEDEGEEEGSGSDSSYGGCSIHGGSHPLLALLALIAGLGLLARRAGWRPTGSQGSRA